jgi:hypothetical protein
VQVQQAFEQLGLGVTHGDAERTFAVVGLFVEVVHERRPNKYLTTEAQRGKAATKKRVENGCPL